MITVWLRDATVRQPVLAFLQPHHLRLRAVTKMEALVLLLKFLVDAPQIAATIRGQEAARVFIFFAVPEACAEHPPDALVPRQLYEGFGIGDADQLPRLGAVTDVLAVAIHIEVRRGAIDELKAALGDRLPVVGGDSLTDNSPCHRNELIIDIVDSKFVDFVANLLDQIVTTLGVYISFNIHLTPRLSFGCVFGRLEVYGNQNS